MPEEKICPFCQSNLTVHLGNEMHCNSCGKSFGLDRNAIATQAANRRAQAGPSSGFRPHHHANDGLQEIEAQINKAEAALREAVRAVLAVKHDDSAFLSLRQDARDAKEHWDELLKLRAERVAATQK